MGQNMWPDAEQALQEAIRLSRESQVRMTAYFALANIAEHVHANPTQGETFLRRAYESNPRHPRAIRTLLSYLQKKKSGPTDEYAKLYEELAETESDPATRSDHLLRAAEARNQLGQRSSAEQDLIEAVAQSPERLDSFERLLAQFVSPKGHDESGLARALTKVIARGDELGKKQARWHYALARLELGPLKRPQAAVTQTERTLEDQPLLFDARVDLAVAFQKAGRASDASRNALSLLQNDPTAVAAISREFRASPSMPRTFVDRRKAYGRSRGRERASFGVRRSRRRATTLAFGPQAGPHRATSCATGPAGTCDARASSRRASCPS